VPVTRDPVYPLAAPLRPKLDEQNPGGFPEIHTSHGFQFLRWVSSTPKHWMSLMLAYHISGPKPSWQLKGSTVQPSFSRPRIVAGRVQIKITH